MLVSSLRYIVVEVIREKAQIPQVMCLIQDDRIKGYRQRSEAAGWTFVMTNVDVEEGVWLLRALSVMRLTLNWMCYGTGSHWRFLRADVVRGAVERMQVSLDVLDLMSNWGLDKVTTKNAAVGVKSRCEESIDGEESRRREDRWFWWTLWIV